MPGLDGFETAEVLRQPIQDPDQIPRIVPLAEEQLAQTRERCAVLGMDAFLAQPLMLETLKEAHTMAGASDMFVLVKVSPILADPDEAAQHKRLDAGRDWLDELEASFFAGIDILKRRIC